jgi:hypothetical protein
MPAPVGCFDADVLNRELPEAARVEAEVAVKVPDAPLYFKNSGDRGLPAERIL